MLVCLAFLVFLDFFDFFDFFFDLVGWRAAERVRELREGPLGNGEHSGCKADNPELDRAVGLVDQIARRPPQPYRPPESWVAKHAQTGSDNVNSSKGRNCNSFTSTQSTAQYVLCDVRSNQARQHTFG